MLHALVRMAGGMVVWMGVCVRTVRMCVVVAMRVGMIVTVLVVVLMIVLV
jgi:hypothetical protein